MEGREKTDQKRKKKEERRQSKGGGGGVPREERTAHEVGWVEGRCSTPKGARRGGERRAGPCGELPFREDRAAKLSTDLKKKSICIM